MYCTVVLHERIAGVSLQRMPTDFPNCIVNPVLMCEHENCQATRRDLLASRAKQGHTFRYWAIGKQVPTSKGAVDSSGRVEFEEKAIVGRSVPDDAAPIKPRLLGIVWVPSDSTNNNHSAANYSRSARWSLIPTFDDFFTCCHLPSLLPSSLSILQKKIPFPTVYARRLPINTPCLSKSASPLYHY